MSCSRRSSRCLPAGAFMSFQMKVSRSATTFTQSGSSPLGSVPAVETGARSRKETGSWHRQRNNQRRLFKMQDLRPSSRNWSTTHTSICWSGESSWKIFRKHPRRGRLSGMASQPGIWGSLTGLISLGVHSRQNNRGCIEDDHAIGLSSPPLCSRDFSTMLIQIRDVAG